MKSTIIKLTIAIICIFLFLQGALLMASDPCTIQGKVVDQKGNPLPYANIFLKGSVEGAMSDKAGEFNFQSRSSLGSATLICTYIGYTNFSVTIQLKSGETITQEIKLQEEGVKGKTVYVTASAFTAADEEGVTLNSMDVVRTPGAAADLFWAIKSFPGLQQVEEGAGLFVRGGDVSETAVYLDGALIHHPYRYESPTGGFFGTFSPFLLKGTFFSSGGFSAQYGHALSGALAMESHDMPSQRMTGLGVGLAALSIFWTQPIVEGKLGFLLSGNKSNTKTMFELNNSRKDFSEYPSAFDLNISTVYKPDPSTQFKFFIFRMQDKVGLQVDDPDFDSHFHCKSSNAFYNVSFRKLVGKKLLIKSNASISKFGHDIHLGVMDLDLEDQMVHGRFLGERELSNHFTIRGGFEYMRRKTLIHGRVPEEEEDVDPHAPSNEVETDYLSHKVSPFFEWDFWTPWGFKVMTGFRGAYESQSEEFHLDPRISLVFPISRYTDITAAWGVYHQYPDPAHYDPYVGNPKLTSMRATHTILGLYHQKESTIYRLEGYYKKYDNLLLDDELSNYSNKGHGYAYGVDVFAKQSIGFASGWVSYSWLHACRRWLDLPVLASPYFDITHNFTAVLNFDLPCRVALGFSFRTATGKPYTPAPESYHSARVPRYQKVDISLSTLRSFFGSNMTILYLAVSNVFGRINVFDYRYSQDFQRRSPVESSFGRSVYFGFQFNL